MMVKQAVMGIKILMLFFFLAFGLAHAEGFKLGFVNTVKLVDKAPQGKAALAAIKAEFADKELELTKINEQIKNTEEDIRTNSLVMSEQGRVEKQRKLRELKRKFEREKTEYREDINLRRNEELGNLQRIIRDAVDSIAREEGFDIVVEQAVYVAEGIDITDKVLEKLGSGN